MESITGATGDGDPATLPGDPITGAQTGDFMGEPATTMGDPIASELGDPSEPTEDPDVTSRDTAAPAKGSTHEIDSLQSSTSLTTPPAVQGVGASETHDGGASSLALLTQSTDGGAASEVRDGGENRHKSMTGNHGEHSEGRDGGKQEERVRSSPWSKDLAGETIYASMPREGITVGGGKGKEVEGSRDIGVKDDKIRGGDETGIVEAVETMPKEGNAMEHLIKDLEELSPVASSHEEKTSKISETSKELSKTIDVWVNGKGVKASGDVNGEKEFTISPSRFSPLQDIDEEEETCLEGSGTEVEEATGVGAKATSGESNWF
ncbi:hypothetical protein YC2023_117910 [Brassica napus]